MALRTDFTVDDDLVETHYDIGARHAGGYHCRDDPLRSLEAKEMMILKPLSFSPGGLMGKEVHAKLQGTCSPSVPNVLP